MVQNEINNMSFLTADNKSKMAKVGALLWEVDLAGREGTPPRASYVPLQLPHLVTFPAALTASSSLMSHFLSSPPYPMSPFPLSLHFPLSQGLGVPGWGMCVGWGRGARVGSTCSWAWGSLRDWGNPSCLCLPPDEAGGRRTGQPLIWNLLHGGSWLIPCSPQVPASALPPEHPCPGSPPSPWRPAVILFSPHAFPLVPNHPFPSLPSALGNFTFFFFNFC